MDIEKFIQMRPSWAFEPCLYIVKQTNVGHNAHRCGSSGTNLYASSDLPYGSERASLTGLLGRMVMYQNMWLPIRGTVVAALRIKKQLVADPSQRTGEDAQGNVYNIDRGNYTLVLHREKEFHAELDRRGLRWQSDRKNELFVPRRGVDELISSMRAVRGEEMFVFQNDSILEDTAYRGGTRRELITITETSSRTQPERAARIPSVTIRLSKASLDQLRSGNPNHFEQLLNIFREYLQEEKAKTKTTSTVTVQMDPADVQDVRDQTDRGVAITRGIQQMVRRSPRLAANDDASTETTITQPPSPTPPRRSARLANKNK